MPSALGVLPRCCLVSACCRVGTGVGFGSIAMGFLCVYVSVPVVHLLNYLTAQTSIFQQFLLNWPCPFSPCLPSLFSRCEHKKNTFTYKKGARGHLCVPSTCAPSSLSSIAILSFGRKKKGNGGGGGENLGALCEQQITSGKKKWKP